MQILFNLFKGGGPKLRSLTVLTQNYFDVVVWNTIPLSSQKSKTIFTYQTEDPNIIQSDSYKDKLVRSLRRKNWIKLIVIYCHLYRFQESLLYCKKLSAFSHCTFETIRILMKSSNFCDLISLFRYPSLVSSKPREVDFHSFVCIGNHSVGASRL